MRVTVNHTMKPALDIFAREIAPAGTSWSPGTTGPGFVRPSASPLVKQFAFTLAKRDVAVRIVVDGKPQPVSVPVEGGYRSVADAPDTVTAPPLAGAAPAPRTDPRWTFVLFGKLQPYKGVDRLVRAVAALDPEVRARMRVIVAGEPLLDLPALEAAIAAAGIGDCLELRPRRQSEPEMQALFAEADYDMAYVFKYSVRTGTPAAALGDPVDEAVKEARNQELLRLLEANSRRRTAALLGTVQEVLVEGPDKRGLRFTGRTRTNRVVHFPADESHIGRLVPVRIDRVTPAALYGEILP